MSEGDDREPVKTLQAPTARQVEARYLRLRLMGVAVSLELLAVLVMPWVNTSYEWGSPSPRSYRGLALIDGSQSPLGGRGEFLIIAYLMLALVCLLFPATIIAVVGSVAGPVVTIIIVLSTPARLDVYFHDDLHVDLTWGPFVAVGIWVVGAVVAMNGWSATRPASKSS
ncbi:MAG: hypothetical protein QOH84_1255 [Kribbellaceae bacterium]|nr:hypothetical protein [Kribbellaceae bacterium]